jgi:hypothetical protein
MNIAVEITDFSTYIIQTHLLGDVDFAPEDTYIYRHA